LAPVGLARRLLLRGWAHGDVTVCCKAVTSTSAPDYLQNSFALSAEMVRLYPKLRDVAHWTDPAKRASRAAQAMRARFFPRAAEEKAPVAATHMPFPGLGRIVSHGGALRWPRR
jgi:hypothetical protein